MSSELDKVGPVESKPSIDQLHHVILRKEKKDTPASLFLPLPLAGDATYQ